MISVPRKARPRRGPNRVQLVDIDGTPVRPSPGPAALAWPDSTDNWRWTIADGPPPAAAALPGLEPEPESDAEWLARLEAAEAAELGRIEASYRPTTADLAAYEEWLASVDDGPTPYVVESCHTIEEWEAIRSGQVTETELAMRAAGMAI